MGTAAAQARGGRAHDELVGWGLGRPGGLGGLEGPSPGTCVPWRTKHFPMGAEPALRSWRELLEFLPSKALSFQERCSVFHGVQHHLE